MNFSALLIFLAILALGSAAVFVTLNPNQPTSSPNPSDFVQSSTNPTPSQTTSSQDNTQLTLGLLPIDCTHDKLAVDFLLDFSTSMSCKNSQNSCKVDSLKKTVASFMSRFPKNDLIGAQTLERNLVSIDKFENIPDFANIISNHDLEGGTPTEKGLNLAFNELQIAKTKFSEYTNWNLIVLTDGCPNPGQKPLIPAQKIRDLGVTVYAVGIELGTAGKCDELGGVTGAEKLMADIAGSPSRAFSTNADNLEGVANQIFQNLCSEN